MERLVRVIRTLFAAYPNARASQENLAAYSLVLKDMPIVELEAVVKQVISSPGEFVPPPGNIMEMWRKAKKMLPPVDGAEQGWLSVKRAVAGVGHTGTPKFKDPITAKTVEAIGWRQLCTSENEVADRAHFMKIYNAFSSRQADDARATTGYKRLSENRLLLEGDSDGDDEIS